MEPLVVPFFLRIFVIQIRKGKYGNTTRTNVKYESTR